MLISAVKHKRRPWTHNQDRSALQNRKIIRELNNVALAELPSDLIRQTLVLTCSL